MTRRAPAPSRILVVLGGTNARNGRLSSMSVRRLRAALAVFRERPDGTAFLLTGGFGAHFNVTAQPHWTYGRAWLQRHGVPAEKFLPGVASTNTPDDARLSARVLAKFPTAQLVLITSDFHAPRARFLFRHHLGPRRVRTVCSACLETFSLRRRVRLQSHERQRVASYRAAAKS
jgi:uncharacterized SAM-binding protein YcdF (DUF218 family)